MEAAEGRERETHTHTRIQRKNEGQSVKGRKVIIDHLYNYLQSKTKILTKKEGGKKKKKKNP